MTMTNLDIEESRTGEQQPTYKPLSIASSLECKGQVLNDDENPGEKHRGGIRNE